MMYYIFQQRPIPKGSVASFFNKKTSDSKQSSTQEKIKNTKKVESPKQIKPPSTSDSSETVSHLSDSKITLESEDFQQLVKVHVAVFCPGYLEWWLNSNLHLVLFTQYLLNTIPIILSERWLIHLRGG